MAHEVLRLRTQLTQRNVLEHFVAVRVELMVPHVDFLRLVEHGINSFRNAELVQKLRVDLSCVFQDCFSDEFLSAAQFLVVQEGQIIFCFEANGEHGFFLRYHRHHCPLVIIQVRNQMKDLAELIEG